jgi:pimeloyl-ACP methyl ester carboxylesterase
MVDHSPPRPPAEPVFASPGGRDRFFAAYDAVLAKWPVAVEPVDVTSAYGTTHVNVCGPTDGRPVVLLHGGGATSTVWFANVGDLARNHRVYAVDIIGGPGRSVANGKPMTSPSDLLDWLDGLLTDLGIDSAYLCGHSYGGWLALSYTAHAPGRVRRLALLDPSQCFAGAKPGYLLHGVPVLLRPTAAKMRALIRWETGGQPVDPTWLDLVATAADDFPSSKVVMPRRPDAARLRAVDVPTLLLLAERSRSHNIRRVATKAQRLMPLLVTAILPGVSHHSVPTENPEQLNRELLEFFV